MEKALFLRFLRFLLITYFITLSLEKEIIVFEKVWKKSWNLDQKSVRTLYRSYRHCVQKCGVDLFDFNQWLTEEFAKKVESDIPGLVYFAIGLVNSVLNLPDVLVKFSGGIQIIYRRSVINPAGLDSSG